MKNITAKYTGYIFLVLVLMLALCTSCVTEKKRARICRECAGKDSVSVITSEKIVQKDTTIYVSIPGPVQFLDNPCKNLCDSLGNLKPFRIETKKNGLKSVVESVGNSIRTECEADSLKQVITYLQKEISRRQYEKKVVPVECEKVHRNGLDYFCRWSALGLGVWFLIRYLITYLRNRSRFP